MRRSCSRIVAVGPIAVVLAVVLALALASCDRTNPDDFKEPKPEPTCEADLATPEGYAAALKCPEYASCAFTCTGCTEDDRPYSCPAMRSWGVVAHAPACGAFTGDPTVDAPPATPGKCTASDPRDDALLTIGLDLAHPGRVHLPDAHFIEPAGREEVLRPPKVSSGFPLDVMLVPQTRFAVVSDAGLYDNAVYVVDLDKVGTGETSITSTVVFPSPAQIEYGLAFAPPGRVFASAGAGGKVLAFSLDTNAGTLVRVPSGDLDLGLTSAGSLSGRWYAGAITLATAGDAELVVAPASFESQLKIGRPDGKGGLDLADTIDLGAGAHDVFDLLRDPNDPTGNTLWLTSAGARKVLRVDLATKKVTASFATGKNPEGVLALDGKYVVVASSDDDVVQLLDATTGQEVQAVHFDVEGRMGAQPGFTAYDAVRKRVYVTLSGVDAIAALSYDATSTTAPLKLLGRIPTAWWPSQVRVRDTDGALVVLTGKGHGTGPAPFAYPPGDGATENLTHGSIAVIPPPSDADLVAMDGVVASSRSNATAARGWPTVTCPAGAPYDFPLPLTNDGAPSTRIEHVVYVVRENKTFDSMFGDLPGVNGDPRMVMAPGRMDEIWRNARAIARAFTVFDNYATSAEQSIQGHTWNAFGRSTDFVERTWTTIPPGARGTRQPRAGIDPDVGSPREGSLFGWAERNHIAYDNMGELSGAAGTQGVDPAYPGLVYSPFRPDVDKSCYIAARARATCDLKSLTYVVLPNDHTVGLTAMGPAPDVMIAVNDEATGMLLDAISHSPLWPTTLVIVTEDDPQDGGEHVDAHRTPLFMASPWIRRGYVSKTRLDAASIHKLIAHVFAKPYLNQGIAEAPLPFDAFSPTPDFTPYTYAPRTVPTKCNPAGTKEAMLAEDWDFSDPDEQPGLSRQVSDYMRKIGKH